MPVGPGVYESSTCWWGIHKQSNRSDGGDTSESTPHRQRSRTSRSTSEASFRFVSGRGLRPSRFAASISSFHRRAARASASRESASYAVGGLWLFVRGQIPFYKNLFGQRDVGPSVVTGFQFQVLARSRFVCAAESVMRF